MRRRLIGNAYLPFSEFQRDIQPPPNLRSRLGALVRRMIGRMPPPGVDKLSYSQAMVRKKWSGRQVLHMQAEDYLVRLGHDGAPGLLARQAAMGHIDIPPVIRFRYQDRLIEVAREEALDDPSVNLC